MGLYGINFGGKHSYNTWGLIPKNRPTPSAPEVKTNYVDVFGSNGSIDLTDFLTGEPTYKDRTIEAVYTTKRDRSEWYALYTEILQHLHGNKLNIILDEDPMFYYVGRCSVSSWQTFEKTAEITITCDVEPYKLFKFDASQGFDWSDLTYGKKTGTFTAIPSYTVTGASSGIHEQAVQYPVYFKGYYPTIKITKTGTSRIRVNATKGTSYKLAFYLEEPCTNKTFTIPCKAKSGTLQGSINIYYTDLNQSTANDVTTFQIYARPRCL